MLKANQDMNITRISLAGVQRISSKMIARGKNYDDGNQYMDRMLRSHYDLHDDCGCDFRMHSQKA
jgi:hypothetical protein